MGVHQSDAFPQYDIAHQPEAAQDGGGHYLQDQRPSWHIVNLQAAGSQPLLVAEVLPTSTGDVKGDLHMRRGCALRRSRREASRICLPHLEAIGQEPHAHSVTICMGQDNHLQQCDR